MHGAWLLGVRVVTTLLQAIGLVCTVWRIYFRLRIDRFWWEDAWATAALFSCLAAMVGEWIFLLTYGLAPIVGFWFYTLGFTSVVRATHLSILFSIIRIVRNSRLGKFTYFCAVCCGVFWIAILSVKITRCASNPRWHHYEVPACIVKRRLLVFELASDCVTVVVLVALPLRVLWRVRLPGRQRRMILSIFASCIVLSFASVFHAVGHILDIKSLMTTGVDFQIATSIIMCNMLVVVTYVYRLLRRGDGSSMAMTASETESDDFTQPAGRAARPPMSLTTVEIGSSIITTQDISSQN